jgi:hypothetical protein
LKKWQIAITVAALAVASAGAVGASLAGALPAEGPIVVVPSTVVVANPNWDPVGPGYNRPATIPVAPALPAATGRVLFSTDFNAPGNPGGTSPLLRDSDLPPAWDVRDGVFQQAGDISGNNRPDEAYYLVGDAAWQDVTVESAILATSGAGAGLVWNVQGDSFYRVQLFPDLPNNAPKARLERVQAGQVTLLAEAPAAAYAGYAPDAWQTVRVENHGAQRQVWVNGTLLFDVQDASLTHGQAGLYAWADSGTRFDNLRVQSAATGN